MAISLNVREADKVKVDIPKVWFFPRVRLRSAIRKAGYDMEVIKSNTGDYDITLVYRKGDNVGTLYTGHDYYPDFKTDDEALKQIVAPYANVRDGR